ncbi:MAG: DNA-3-methyladenine glycosylase I [Candidatus Omnitrophica bacterium]|nr:DNA-3-methyladenine glycosylase I [Candidatus Omnitrophota bacterium]
MKLSKPQIKKRCAWVPEADELYQLYHDVEWGVPVYDDHKIFEFLILESAQAGLSWITVLRKRENYRKAFAGFDPTQVVQFSRGDIQKLLQNPGIIRNRLKVEAAVNNAKYFLAIQKEFGTFSKYIWRFVDGKPLRNRWKSFSDLPTKTKEAENLSKDLKERGFKFLGPTVVYAHMQATGMVNDHTTDCFRYEEVSQ